MELIAVIAIVVGLFILYFLAGITLQFIWGWWPLIIATPVSIFVGVSYGWVGAIFGFTLFLAAISANNNWQSAALHAAVSSRIETLFNFKDT